MNEHIEQAVRILNEGGIVIFPTDTAFGIGCRIDNPQAIKKLFAIRERPATMPMPVLCNSVPMAEQYVKEIPSLVRERLTTEHWPGALTIILEANKNTVPELVRGGGSNVGIRIPNHKIPLSLIAKTGVPILGSSANFHGGKTPYDIVDINPHLIYLSDYIVPGTCTVGRESTVIDCTKIPWKIVRQGAITLDLRFRN